MEPILPPEPTPSVVPQNQSQPARSRMWVWVLVGTLIVIGAAGAVYWFMPDLFFGGGATPSASTTVTPSQSGDVRWQTWERYSGADFLPHDAPCKPGECEVGYLIGEFIKEPYQSGKLYAVSSTEGMGQGRPYMIVLKSDGKKVLLERDGEQYYQNTGQILPFVIDRDYAIPELQIPSVLVSPDGKLVLERQPQGFFGPPGRWDELGKNIPPLVKVFTDPLWGDVYTDTVPTTPLPSPGPDAMRPGGYNGFYIRLPSGMTAVYAQRIDFMKDGSPVGIRWSSGVYAGGEYIWTGYGGCGVNNILEVVYPYQLDAEKDLKEIGRTPANEPLLGFKDSNHAYLRNLYDTQYFVMQPQQKMAYDQFVASVPVFFWRDPLERLVRFENKIFLPQAECGKPVIYLYPEQTTKVSVKVSPVGGMTFSEPVYGDGWTVTAQPDGALTDASGAQWPYLFWEGRGGLYEQPKRGWVVARDEVERLLDEKLSALGLIHQEIADFKEFWLPRMHDAPYYFVTFLGNRAMDELAPLSVSPLPDTVIRVLMDFSPLAEYTSVSPYSIRTPARNGFTVVEWGGVIR